MKSPAPQLVIVSPVLSDANNGNWQTAKRWARLLSESYRTRIVQHWPDTPAPASVYAPSPALDVVMVALHARRSADSVAAWHAQRGSKGLVVALTGTDLYRDIHTDSAAQQSLALAKSLIVLQSLGIEKLPAMYRTKTRVVLQSTTSRQTLPKTARHLRALMVGHLREEKSPQTLFAAAQLLQGSGIKIDHIGAGLDDNLAQSAIKTEAACAYYTWLRALKHAQTRAHIQRAHVLVHASIMEGGAHVIMEAVCSGTPVVASRIDGNVGMLGEHYAGYFPVGDAQALAAMLLRCKNEPLFLDQLRRQCAVRAPLFTATAERAALLRAISFS